MSKDLRTSINQALQMHLRHFKDRDTNTLEKMTTVCSDLSAPSATSVHFWYLYINNFIISQQKWISSQIYTNFTNPKIPQSIPVCDESVHCALNPGTQNQNL